MTFNDASVTIILSTGIILLLIATVIIITIIASRQRVQQLMELTTVQLNFEKELRMAEYEMQEATMNSISRELHDNIGQLLTLMKIQIESTQVSNPATQAILSPIDETLGSVHEQLKSLSKTLSSDIIHQQGMLFAINRDIEKFGSFIPFEIDWQHDAVEPRLNDDERLMAYRIFQELMQNIIKHAEATKVEIKLFGEHDFFLQVTDNGKGFDYTQTISNAGSGLRNIDKRAGMVQFGYDIVSTPGTGTSVTICKKAP